MMIQPLLKKILFVILVFSLARSGYAQNPLITNQYTADPSARVFGDRVYIYPSHDILCTEGKGRIGWFCMEDYHVFSSSNLTDWKDHGVIVSQDKVPWVDPAGYSMWAPDCISRNGKYYFYFPSRARDTVANGKGFSIGVAVSDTPIGPFVPQSEPIKKVQGIDPNVFIDKDGQAYLYWSQGNIYGAKLKENMLELASDPVILQELPSEGLKEGPYVFERNGKYYMTYPHVQNKIERLEYAIGDNPLGPFRKAGVIMDESSTGCWTNHHSIVNFKKQWYLFYHHNDLSPNFDKNRSIRADSLLFNTDGTIRKVIPTLRGIGLSSALKEIQLDRYSDLSRNGVKVDFLDTANRMMGWKATLAQSDAWIRYNAVDFSVSKLKKLHVRAWSAQGAVLEIRVNKIDGPLIDKVNIGSSTDWKLVTSSKASVLRGVHDLFVVLKSADPVSVDWIRFEK
ncbi:family 43 glycosylhydrolase [Arcticibacter eurypsychrophilus]|uniref:family 43 glycosylhydrolase n=1 Tax=Arcticibacter eurypsychrophilus TaxID=1434752 RepID=UPI000B2BCFCF|nr:family 43 glycosylhydrolase [Arcticibacter eurypsychrophilus]